MVQTTIYANDVQQYVLQAFGNRQITAIRTGDVVLLVAGVQHSSKEQNNVATADGLYGMFKNTSLLSSDEFAKNKQFEKIIEDERLNV